MIENPKPGAMRQPQRLEDLLSFRLHNLNAVGGASVIRLLEGRYGITRREWRLLAHLWQAGERSPSDLAVEIRLDRARTSKAIGLLLTKGLIERRLLPHDPRRAMVGLTSQGVTLVQEVFPQVAEIHENWVSVLNDQELALLQKMLDVLTQQAHHINTNFATDVKADRKHGKRSPPTN
ncbi:MAG: MarR family transcriptional regulator [Pseudomonadota bacterium]|jgi:DNA-binding MarR family transcriptional regulator